MVENVGAQLRQLDERFPTILAAVRLDAGVGAHMPIQGLLSSKLRIALKEEAWVRQTPGEAFSRRYHFTHKSFSKYSERSRKDNKPINKSVPNTRSFAISKIIKTIRIRYK